MSTIKIGVVGPKTGPLSDMASMLFTGAGQAIKDINAKGGVNGKLFQAYEYDDAGDPRQAIAVANEVVNDAVHLVVGHMTSASVSTVSNIYEDEEVLLVTPGATARDITTRGFQMMFRTMGSDAGQASNAVSQIIEYVKPEVIAVVHDKQVYGQGLAEAVRQGLKAKGVQADFFEAVNPGDKNFSSLIAKLKQRQADLVYYGGYYPELAQIMRQAQAAGLHAKFMAGDGAFSDSMQQIAGKACEGLMATVPRLTSQDPKNRELTERIRANAKNPGGIYVLPSYAAVQLIAQGIAAAGSVEATKVAQAIHAGSFDTVLGALTFDDRGDTREAEFEVRKMHYDASAERAEQR